MKKICSEISKFQYQMSWWFTTNIYHNIWCETVSLILYLKMDVSLPDQTSTKTVLWEALLAYMELKNPNKNDSHSYVLLTAMRETITANLKFMIINWNSHTQWHFSAELSISSQYKFNLRYHEHCFSIHTNQHYRL